MPYLMATLQETLRYITVVLLGVFHRTLNDTTIDGRFVPADTTIWFNHFGLNHDENTFTEPYAFKPDRFLDEEGEFLPADHPNRRAINALVLDPTCVWERRWPRGGCFR